MPDLKTTYLGLELKNPLVISASPLSDSVETMRLLELAGASAIVMSSMFEEQIVMEGSALEHYMSSGTESYSESTSYFPDISDFNIGPQQHLELLHQAKQKLSIPIIASLNGCSASGWTDWAKRAQDAGADALELNEYYIPTDLELSGRDVEQRYIDVLKMVKEHVTIPVSVKLNPYFSNTANMCNRLVEAGANGLVLFNRFYQPDFDLENLEVVPRLVLSNSHELRLPLRWVAILYGRLATDLAITTGIHTGVDVIKAMMAGANVAMMASEILRNGSERVSGVLEEMTIWMDAHEYESVAQMCGSMSQIYVGDPAAFERGNYIKMLQSWHPQLPGMR